MSSTIIDETVILRYLLDDDEVLSPRAAKVIATRTARVYPEIITRVVVTLRDVYKVPRVEIAAAMKRLLDDVVSFGKPVIQGMIDYRRKRQTAAETRDRAADARGRAAEARSHGTDATIDKLRHRPRS